MGSFWEDHLWKPRSQEIKEALDELYVCVRRLSGAWSENSEVVARKQDDLIDARIKLLKLHKSLMTNKENKRRAINTIRYMKDQKYQPPAFIRKKISHSR